MRINADCTLYSRLCDPITREESWQRTELRGVMWQDERHVSVGERGLQRADSTVVYIPCSMSAAALYVSPDIFPNEYSECWTLQAGDFMTHGIVKEESPPTSARLILGVNNHDFGSRQMRHWEVQLR